MTTMSLTSMILALVAAGPGLMEVAVFGRIFALERL
jgi:hypothetical protein